MFLKKVKIFSDKIHRFKINLSLFSHNFDFLSNLHSVCGRTPMIQGISDMLILFRIVDF